MEWSQWSYINADLQTSLRVWMRQKERNRVVNKLTHLWSRKSIVLRNDTHAIHHNPIYTSLYRLVSLISCPNTYNGHHECAKKRHRFTSKRMKIWFVFWANKWIYSVELQVWYNNEWRVSGGGWNIRIIHTSQYNSFTSFHCRTIEEK